MNQIRHLLSLLLFLPAFSPLTLHATDAVLDNSLDDEPLLPEVAFVLSASSTAADMIRAEWKIAEGYYLYRNKFKFESHTDGVTPMPAVYPKGKVKHDEFFGEVETYRNHVAIDIPLTRNSSSQTLDLTITSQGCADIGICYPPQKQKVSLTLPDAPGSVQTNPVSDAGNSTSSNPLLALKKLGASLGLGGDDEFLKPEQAFMFSAQVENGNLLTAHWDIADGYYLYRDKFSFELRDAEGIRIGEINMPSGKEKVDESFGKMVVYFNTLDVPLPLTRTKLEATNITLVVKYQGCAEKGLCYPPQTKEMPLSLPAGQAQPSSLSTDSSTSGNPVDSEGDQRSFIGNLLFAFGIGFLLSFTPCVLPMIPILVGVIVGQSGKQPSKLRSGTLSISYVMGTAVTYSIAGWLAGASGQQLQAYTQNAWALGFVALVLVVLALAMFGFYEIQMPSAIQSRLQTKSQNVKGGSLFGTFFLGLVSALIVGACVTPLLMLVLGIAIQSGDPVLGASMMFAMAMGMGVVLVTVGVGAGHLLPKAGTWMDTVKYTFGVLLIGVAIYLLTPLQAVPILLLWGIFLIVVGIYMGATQAIPEGASNWRTMWKALGTVLLIWGVLALIGGMQGNRDIMQPINLTNFSMGSGMMSQSGSAMGEVVDAHSLFVQLKNTQDLDEQLARAKSSGKKVLLDYYAVWCTDCRRMEKATFENPKVQAYLKQHFIALQVDVTDPNNEDTEAVKKRFKVFGPPAMLFFGRDGQLRKDLNFYGFKDADDFLETLGKV